MLIKNCQLFDSESKTNTDIRIDNGKIVEIGSAGKELKALNDETVFDAAGLWLLPGFID